MSDIKQQCAEEGHESHYCRCAARNIADNAVKLERARIEKALDFTPYYVADVLRIVRGEKP
jgi:hypothetical protein